MDGITPYNPNIDDTELIDQARKKIRYVLDRENEVREKMRDDIRFVNGEHWDERITNTRKSENKPALTVPRMNQFLNKIKNENRQSSPSIKVSAGDSFNDVPEKMRLKQADRRQGRIRAIQYESCAQDAYQNAFDFAVDCGRGFFRVLTTWVNDESFQQKIMIDLLPNPLRVYMDPDHKEKDYSDCKYGAILVDYPLDKFKGEFEEKEPIDFVEEEDRTKTKECVTLAEFYCIWAKKRELWQMEDGTEIFKDEIDKEFKQDIKPVKKRIVSEPYVMWYLLSGVDVLKKKYIPGKYIPIIPVVGKERDVLGQLDIRGLTRELKDSQKLYNYWSSSEAERLMLSVKSEFIAEKRQLVGYEPIWESANTKNWAVLPYNAVTEAGHLLPPPQRQFPKPPDSGLLTAKMGVIDDMKAISGIFNPSLGQQGNETSGRAIMARQRQSDTANFHFFDGMRIAITQAGKIINEWLPIYENKVQNVKTLDEEDNESTLKLGSYEDGEVVDYGEGEFSLVVTMGANFTTRREQALEMMMELVRAVPQIAPLIYDILVKNIDAPGAMEISERLKKTIPPQILEQEGGEAKMQQAIQQAMQQIQKDKMLIQALQQQLQKVSQELETKGIENKTKVQIAQMNNLTDIEIANIKAKTEEDKERSKLQSLWFKAVTEGSPQPTGVLQ